jgi:cytochrome c oxidase subunit 2
VWAHRVNISPSKNKLEVRIVAEQFAWNIHYPGKDGKFGTTNLNLVDSDNPIGIDRNDIYANDDIITINQFNLPVNEPILIYLTSKDVIHSLNLPYMRVKQDAIPGISVPIQLEANKTSKQLQEEIARYVSTSDSLRTFNLVSMQEYTAKDGTIILAKYDYLSDEANTKLHNAGITHIRVAEDIPSEIACAQLCGLGHFRMRGYMTVQTKEEFETWMNEQTAELNQ